MKERIKELQAEVKRLKRLLRSIVPDAISFLENCPKGQYNKFCLKDESDGYGINCKYCWENYLKEQLKKRDKVKVKKEQRELKLEELSGGTSK